MNSNIILFTSFALLFLFISTSECRGVTDQEDGDFEEQREKATEFLTQNTDNVVHNLAKRESGRNCVPCKFGINPCCAPNFCKKKTLRPDECVEVKVPHHH